MSKFMQSVKFEEDFEGDHVVATFAPLSFEDVLVIENIEIEDVPENADAKTRVAAVSKQQMELARVLIGFLPKYNRSLQGLQDAAGAPISFDQMCATAYFADLIASMGKCLIRAAYPMRPKKPDATSAS